MPRPATHATTDTLPSIRIHAALFDATASARRRLAAMTQGGISLRAQEREAVHVIRYGPRRSTAYPVGWTPQPLGGARPHFVCPGCSRPAGVLYLPDDTATDGGKCRKCWGLTYPSQRATPEQRAQAKARALSLALWGRERVHWTMQRRPRGMHRRTYTRKATQADRAQARAEALAPRAPTWDERFDRWMRERDREIARAEARERRTGGEPRLLKNVETLEGARERRLWVWLHSRIQADPKTTLAAS